MSKCLRHNSAFYVLIVWMLFNFVGGVNAHEVSIQHKGLKLNANLELAAGASINESIILLVHGNMAHYGMEIMQTSQSVFKENGFDSLAINLSLKVDDRRGMYDCNIPVRYTLKDTLDELDTWLDWLGGQGVKKIVMLGHSLAANYVLLHSAERNNDLVSALLLLAPNTTGFPASSERYHESYGVNLYEILATASRQKKAGRGSDLMENTDFGFCPRTRVSAEAFIDFYQPNNDVWGAHHFLPSIATPTLIVAGSDDKLQPNIEEHVRPYVDDRTVSLSMIEGSGHFFRDFNTDEAVESCISFLTSNDYL